MEADSSPTTGIVYVLTNPAMPGIVKIGRTARGSIDARLNELYSTGVPVPFECAFAGRVADEARVERAFHLAFGLYRINPKREFFQIEPEQAVALLELMVVDDITPELQREADEVDVDSREGARRLKARRPVQNFVEIEYLPDGRRGRRRGHGVRRFPGTPRSQAHLRLGGELHAIRDGARPDGHPPASRGDRGVPELTREAA